MRIAFDYQTFCNQKFGGVSRYFSSLAGQLDALEQDVRIFAPLHQNHYAKDLPTGIVQGFSVPRYPPRSWSLLTAVNLFVTRPAIKKWNPDIVHETFYSPHRSGPRTSPTVITVYDMIHELFKESFSANDPTTRIKRMAINRADHVICISNSTRVDLINIFGIPEEKVSCVHLGFEKFLPSALDFIAKKQIERPFLLHVSGRSGYKNFSNLLHSVAKSNKLLRDFDIVAFGGGRFTPFERALIKELGFGDSQVRWVTGNDALLGSYYKQANAFVYPSLYEGFGFPPLEAMAQNCPVISSNTSSMPEVIGVAAEFFDPNEIDDMTRAIESVVYSEERTRQLKSLGHMQLKCYSWGRCAEETLAIYNRLI